MSKKSVVAGSPGNRLAIELIQLGARLQLLETEVSLSRERLLKLYKELKGVSPPKGMLPFSTDWFLTWQPNIHASLFINIHGFLVDNAGATGIEAVMKAYKLYLEQMPPEPGEEPLLSLTRAWTLVRFFQSNMLTMAPCACCSGQVRRQRPGPEPGLPVRPVPHAFARRQDQEGQGRRERSRLAGRVIFIDRISRKGRARVLPFACALAFFDDAAGGARRAGPADPAGLPACDVTRRSGCCCGAGVPLDWPGAALMQGLLAAAVSRWFTLAPWWLADPAGFSPGAGGRRPACALPSWLFLALFSSFCWSSTGRPFAPRCRIFLPASGPGMRWGPAAGSALSS